METLTDYKCCCHLSGFPSLTFPCVWRGWIYSVYLSWPLSRLPCVFWKLWRIIFNMCLLTLYMYLGFYFHNFVLFIILLYIFFFLREITGKLFLLAAIFHMEHNINFLFSIVATYARMEIPCMLYFSSLLWIAVTAPCWRQSCACVLSHSVVSDSLWPQGM